MIILYDCVLKIDVSAVLSEVYVLKRWTEMIKRP